MIPSIEQEAFLHALLETDRNILLIACAGSGKTTTMELGISALSTKGIQARQIVACAFNKDIAKELDRRVGRHATCKTLHSLGLAACHKLLPGKPDIRPRKTLEFLSDPVGATRNSFPSFERALGLGKAAGYVPSTICQKYGIRSLAPVDWDWTWVLEQIDEPMHPRPEQALEEALILSIQLALDPSKRYIEFDDMLYMPTIFNAPMESPKYLFVDEAQDLSPIQLEQISHMIGSTGRLIAVGDPAQAIYAFRGADHKSIPKLIERFSPIELPLSVSYRCPQLVVKRAQAFCTHIHPHEHAPQGRVEHIGDYNPKMFQWGDAILCRNTAPLVKLCLKLLSNGVGATIRGKDIGASIAAFFNRPRVKKARTLGEAWPLIKESMATELLELETKGRYGQLEMLLDKLECLQAVCKALPNDAPIQSARDQIKKLFSEDNELILLSTIHRAKGLEWDKVYFLDDSLIPSKFATSEAALTQERNLMYVGLTRSKNELLFITTPLNGDQSDAKV